MKQCLFTISTLILMGTASRLFAQDTSNIKIDKKTQVALASRYETDKSFAQTARSMANNNLNTWVGAKLADLVNQWGAYTRIVSDGADGQIAVYENNVSGTSGSYTPGSVSWDDYGNITSYRSATDTRSSYSYTQYTEFYIDKNKIITRVKTGTR